MPELTPAVEQMKRLTDAMCAHLILGFCCTDKEAWYRLQHEETGKFGTLAKYWAGTLEIHINAGKAVLLDHVYEALLTAEECWHRETQEHRPLPPAAAVKVADFLTEHWLFGHDLGPFLGEAARLIGEGAKRL